MSINMKKFDKIKHTIRKVEGIIEIIIMTVVYYSIWKDKYSVNDFPPYYGRGKYVLAGVYFFLLLILYYYNDGFKFGYLKLSDVIMSQWISTFIVNFITYFQLSLIANKLLNVVPMLMLMGMELFISILFIILFSGVYHLLYTPRNMLMIYGNKDSVVLKAKMDTRLDKYRVKDIVSVEVGMHKLCEMMKDYDAVVISDIPALERNDLLKYCYANNIRTYVTPKISDIIIRGSDSIHLFDTPLVMIGANGLNYEQRFLKRTLDLVLCGIAMLVLWPIMLVIAIAIKIEDGGPVFYKQKRVTINNREFNILKFRSMIVDAEKEGKSIPATDHDPRITKVGRVIRATRLDELPQIINILKNDMSIVGPRPERIEHVEEFVKDIPEFEFRTKVKGGLTGYAQIFGKYNTSAYDKLKLDLMYIENYSLFLDLRLILMTVSIMFKKESTEGFDKVLDPEDIIEEVANERE